MVRSNGQESAPMVLTFCKIVHYNSKVLERHYVLFTNKREILFNISLAEHSSREYTCVLQPFIRNSCHIFFNTNAD